MWPPTTEAGLTSLLVSVHNEDGYKDHQQNERTAEQNVERALSVAVFLFDFASVAIVEVALFFEQKPDLRHTVLPAF